VFEKRKISYIHKYENNIFVDDNGLTVGEICKPDLA
jgi:hypothetical protein